MTKDRRAKDSARACSARTGESYTASRRKTGERTPIDERLGELRDRLIPNATTSFEADHCANCFRPLPDDVEGLFCESWCNEIADNVRYWRRVHRDGRATDPEVQQAIRTRVALMLAGGYDSLGRRLTASTRSQVKQRDGGRCVQCDKPGTEIDHIAGSSSDLANLQLLCQDCHQAKTRRNMVPAGQDEQLIVKMLFQRRVLPDIPSRVADDQVEWPKRWRQLKRERRERFIVRLQAAGIETSGTWTRAAMVLELEDALTDSWAEVSVTEDDDSGYGPNSYFARAMARDD